MPEKATRFLWRAAGCPAPLETDGAPIQPRGPTGQCAGCGEPAEYRLKDAISDNCGTVANLGRAWPFGGDAVCAACVWCCKAMALKCGLSFVTENGFMFTHTRPFSEEALKKVSFEDVQDRTDPLAAMFRTKLEWTQAGRRPDPLAVILSPPDPPFVAMFPLYGIDKGTEANCHRSLWPGVPTPVDPLKKCQSKHVAIYATIATSRDQYPLQVDNTDPVIVDVALWIELRAQCESVLKKLRAAGVGSEDARTALCKGRQPPRCSLLIARDWRTWTSWIAPYRGAAWFELLVSLIPMPERTEVNRGRKRNAEVDTA